MAVQENTLGAPTEGLGQTVTFAAGSQGGMSQASAGRQVQQRTDIQGGFGGNVNRALQIPERGPDPTMQVLFKMGATILAPAIKAEQEAGFVRGMQRAASGQAVADIVEEQPWYSKAFGTTDVVDGARAYTAFAKANELSTSIQAAMPELRKLSGPQFAEHVQRQIASTKTGDEATDTMVFQQAMKQMPEQMAQQTKHNYVYKQERMVDAQRQAMGAALTNVGVVTTKYRMASPGDAFQPAVQNEITDSIDADGAKIGAVQAFIRPEGMDPKVHSRNVTLALAAAASEGNLAGVYAMQDAGIVDQLQDDDKVHVNRALEGAERKARLMIDAPLAIQAAQWQTLANEPDTAPETIIAGAKALNEQYARLTGSRAPLVAQADTVRELVQLETTRINAQHREAARLTAAAAKAATVDEKQALHNQKIEMGAAALSTGSDISFLKEPEAQEAWAYKRSVSTDEQYFSAMAASAERSGGVNKAFKETLQTEINLAVSQSNPQTLHDVYTKHYLPLRTAAKAQGTKVAATYTGEYAAKMDEYHRFMQATGTVSEGDKTVALLKFAQPRAKVDNSKDAVEFQKVAAQKGVWQTLGNLFDDKPPLDATLAPQFVSELMPYMDNLPATLSTKDKLKEAAKMAGVEQYAGTYWKRGLDQAPIEQALVKPERNGRPNPTQIQATELDAAIKLGFSQALTKAGLVDSGVSAYRMPDDNGEAMFYVLSSTDKGEPNGILIRGSEIESAWANKKQAGALEDIAYMENALKAGKGSGSGSKFTKDEVKDYQDRINRKLIEIGQPPKY